MPREYSEDKLVQETTANYFRDTLHWEMVNAYNEEVIGIDGTLGRTSEKEVVLIRYLRNSLEKLNPGLPESAYDAAVKEILEISLSCPLIQQNREKYDLFSNGVLVRYTNDKKENKNERLKVFDFDNPAKNHFLLVRELWIKGPLYRRRADIVGFVNGIPLLFMELKTVHKNVRNAYDQNLMDYYDTIPHLFIYNAMIMLSNGDRAKVGTISAKYDHFMDWKRLKEEDEGSLDFEKMLRGMCNKETFLDLFENFILYDETLGFCVKILARNHQFLGVNRTIEAIRDREKREGRLGVFWHTQGSGKSYSMAFLCKKAHRKLQGNFTFLVVTDREELEKQIYDTFTGTGLVLEEKCKATDGKHLSELFKEDHPYLFTMIHKFNVELKTGDSYSLRKDIIVLSDEAHRTQYGRLALNMRNALPNASFVGFTGTPLFKDDEITMRIFGGYVSTYDFKRAVDDCATVPLYYESRGEKLKLSTERINEKIAEALENVELDADEQALLEKELSREYHIITSGKRLDAIARDFVRHYTDRWESGKAMLICIDKITTVRMYDLVRKYWAEKITELEHRRQYQKDPQELAPLSRKEQWMKETRIAVIVSEEQGEVDRFRKWNLDIEPHRRIIKNGFETPDGERVETETAFKKDGHPFRIAIVCAMWLTGFDVKSLATLYLDKPLKAHTLMQAIARANRVNEGKENGLVVDYCGILKNLRKALASYGTRKDGEGGEEPAKPDTELLNRLREAINETKAFLSKLGFAVESIINADGFDKIRAIREAKNLINANDETRKGFEVRSREVFSWFKAAIHLRNEINAYRREYGAIDVIYKKLQEDKLAADISGIIRTLHEVVERNIEPEQAHVVEDKTFDISKINFDILKAEFGKYPAKNTLVQELKSAIEQKLRKLIRNNPLRVNLQDRYNRIIEEYNNEKDRQTIEQTFEELYKFVTTLNEEETKAAREGLDEEKLAMFDLLKKPGLSPQSINKIKKVAADLLEALKREKLKIDHWREKESTRAEVRQYIYDFLYSEKTGLPVEDFSDSEVPNIVENVYAHVFRQYESAKHNVYSAA